MVTFPQPVLIIESEQLSRFAEARAEQTDDNVKSGFSNLTNSRDDFVDLGGDNKIHGRGGNDPDRRR